MSNLVRAEQQTNVVGPSPYSPQDLPSAMKVAHMVVASRLAPGLDTAEKAFIVLAMGHDMGLSPAQSIRVIKMIQGTPSPSADALVAVCVRSPLCEYFVCASQTEESVTWETKRRGDKKPVQSTYTMADARKAGLVKDGSGWTKYPKRMLSARAKSFLARDVYPELCLGLISQEELTTEDPGTDPTPKRVEVKVVDVKPTTPEVVEAESSEASPESSDQAKPSFDVKAFADAQTKEELDAAWKAAMASGASKDTMTPLYRERLRKLRAQTGEGVAA